jgi:hypothetical protein
MLTNPLVTIPAIPTDGDRPTLRIAARTTPVAGDADPAVAPSTTHEAGGWKADVAGLLERITAGAAADAAQAAAQARAQAQVQITELEQKIIALQSNMDSLRTSGESERSELQRQCRERVSAAESLVETLRAELAGHKAELLVVRQQLEAAIAERSKLTATFRLVQRALALTTTDGLPDMTDAAASTAASVETVSHQPSAEHAAAAPIIEAAPKPDESPIVVINAPQEAIDDVRRDRDRRSPHREPPSRPCDDPGALEHWRRRRPGAVRAAHGPAPRQAQRHVVRASPQHRGLRVAHDRRDRAPLTSAP